MNGSGADKRREIESEETRWSEAINMKDKELEVMMVPKIVQLKEMRRVKKVNRMKQVKNGEMESHLKRLSKRETAINVDAIDDAIKKATESGIESAMKLPSGSELEETFNPQVTTPSEVNDREEIKSLIDVVRFPDEAVDRVVDGIRTGIDSLIPEQVKKVRQETEARAVQVLQPIILKAAELFNLGSNSDSDQSGEFVVMEDSSKDSISLPRKTKPSDSGLFHVFRGVLG